MFGIILTHVKRKDFFRRKEFVEKKNLNKCSNLQMQKTAKEIKFSTVSISSKFYTIFHDTLIF